MNKLRKKKIIIVLLLISSVLLGAAIINGPFSQKQDNSGLIQKLNNSDQSTFDYIRANLSDIISDRGLVETTYLAKEAFREEEITIYECHLLAHLLGHKSNLSMEKNLDLLQKIGVDYCEGGFKHGMEAEIALRGMNDGSDYRKKLYQMCELLADTSKIGCYHGAGHEFLSQTKDVDKALALCDTLTGGPEKDLRHCYTGIFSEFTNLASGIDGGTGHFLTGKLPFELNVHPIDYCASFDAKYQESCVREVAGYENARHESLTDLTESLMKCVDNQHEQTLKEACLKSIGGVSTQHALPNKKTIIPPAYIHSLTQNFRLAYIEGVGNEMNQFIINGVEKDWKSFCSAFPSEDYRYCSAIFLSKRS